ncbi:MAG: GNAT family N-acetyltransferase [Flavobacteriaceae bacterium]|nr:GNAT family N-acetyltransferase [Flavobacteriaceae bacterium]
MKEITTARLKLIPLEEKYFMEIHRMCCFPEVAKFNTIGIPKEFEVTSERLHQLLEKKTSNVWVILDKDSQEFYGEFGMTLSPTRYKKAEIYYNLLPSVWAKGYASEAAKAIIDFGFTQLKLHRIEAGVATENLASIRVLEKVGMQREGLCREILPLQTGWSDNYMYSVLESDPPS